MAPVTPKNFHQSWRAVSRPSGRKGRTSKPARFKPSAAVRTAARVSEVTGVRPSSSKYPMRSFFRLARPADGNWSGRRIAIIRTLHDFKQDFQISNRTRHGAHYTDQGERTDGDREMSSGRNSSGRRFQSADAAEVSRDADGTSAIASDATCRKSSRNGSRFSATGASSRAREIPWIVGTAI